MVLGQSGHRQSSVSCGRDRDREVYIAKTWWREWEGSRVHIHYRLPCHTVSGDARSCAYVYICKEDRGACRVLCSAVFKNDDGLINFILTGTGGLAWRGMRSAVVWGMGTYWLCGWRLSSAVVSHIRFVVQMLFLSLLDTHSPSSSWRCFGIGQTSLVVDLHQASQNISDPIPSVVT